MPDDTPCKVLTASGSEVFRGTYDQCVAYMRRHRRAALRGDLDIIYCSTGRCASYML
jgi:hypothetical protein